MSDDAAPEWRLDFDPRPPRTRGGTSPRPGKTLAGRYELGAVLGRGASGVVHRARDTQTGHDVAVKVLRGTLTITGRERFRREGVLTAALEHPGIVRLLDSGESELGPFLVHEVVEGATSLGEALARADRARRIELVRGVARAMSYAHARGVVHRDLKESNVLVDASGRPRVIDFGLAWTQDADSLTESGALVGTPRTMAPEQLAGRRDQLGPAADVWALGTILYTALADAPPFPAESLVALVERVKRPPVALATHDPTIPAALEAVCRRCLAFEPTRRFADAGEMGAALDAALVGAGSSRARGPALAVVVLVGAGALGLGAIVAGRRNDPGAPTPGASSGATPASPTSGSRGSGSSTTGSPTSETPTTGAAPGERRSAPDLKREAALEASLVESPVRTDDARELAQRLLLGHEDAAAALVPLAGRELSGEGEALRELLVSTLETADPWVTRASSDSGPEWIAEHAIDGDLATCWSSAGHASDQTVEWLALNLGASRSVGAVRLFPRDQALGFPRAFKIERSVDGRSWQPVAFADAIARPPEIRWHEVRFEAPVAARALRLRATTLGRDNFGNAFFQLAELEVVAPGGEKIVPACGAVTATSLAGCPEDWRTAAGRWLAREAEREVALATRDSTGAASATGIGRARRCLEGAAVLAPSSTPTSSNAVDVGVERPDLLERARAVEREGLPATPELLAAFERAVQATPADLELRDHGAVLLVRGGQLSRAERQLEIALTTPQEQPWARIAFALLLGARRAPRSDVMAAFSLARPAFDATGARPGSFPELAPYNLEGK